jgi:hypothetical protein
VAFLHVKASGRINYHAPTEISTTHGEGSVQLHRNVGNSRQRNTWVAEAAGDWRLGPTVYMVFSFRLVDCSVTSVTVQTAFVRGRGIQSRRLGDGGVRQRSSPREWNSGSRFNENRKTDCGSLRPSYTGWCRAGSTTTHRARKVPLTAREETKYRAQKEIAVRATRGSRRRPGFGGCDPRFMSYARFV